MPVFIQNDVFPVPALFVIDKLGVAPPPQTGAEIVKLEKVELLESCIIYNVAPQTLVQLKLIEQHPRFEPAAGSISVGGADSQSTVVKFT